ncbi:unnamed protein product [Durusdinium trenchii]|uniref:Uncharacterized protein n=1 Tax=Durusdinium trenchii TaxID=1381693 RepID=A0ABP0NK93_9DINO
MVSSSVPGHPSPSEMPVPTEMPSSPTIAVRTAASKVDVSTGEPTQFSGIAMHSSAMVSSALALSPSDLPVPTDLPSPTSIACAAAAGEPTLFSGERAAQAEEMIPPWQASGLHSSAMGPGSSAPESPSEMPVPTEMPTSPAMDIGEAPLPVPIAPLSEGEEEATVQEAEVPMPLRSAGLHSSALVSSSIGSPSEMPVPTELPTSPVSETDEVETVQEPTIFSGGEPTRQVPTRLSEPTITATVTRRPARLKPPSSPVDMVPSQMASPTSPHGVEEATLETVPVEQPVTVMESAGLVSASVASPSEMAVPTSVPTPSEEDDPEQIPEPTAVPVPRQVDHMSSSAMWMSSSAMIQTSSGVMPSPTEMPVPTDLPSPTSPAVEPTATIPTATALTMDTRATATPTATRRVPGTEVPKETPIPQFSSAMAVSSTAVDSPSEMPVPTEEPEPTSPADEEEEELLPVPEVSSAAGSESAVPVPTLVPTNTLTATMSSLGVPTLIVDDEEAPPLMESAMLAPDSALQIPSPDDVAVPTDVPSPTSVAAPVDVLSEEETALSAPPMLEEPEAPADFPPPMPESAPMSSAPYSSPSAPPSPEVMAPPVEPGPPAEPRLPFEPGPPAEPRLPFEPGPPVEPRLPFEPGAPVEARSRGRYEPYGPPPVARARRYQGKGEVPDRATGAHGQAIAHLSSATGRAKASHGEILRYRAWGVGWYRTAQETVPTREVEEKSPTELPVPTDKPSPTSPAQQAGQKASHGEILRYRAWGVGWYRSRIRTVNRLLTEEAVSGEDAVATKGAVPKTLGNLKHNKHVMGPVLRRLSGNQDKVPCLQESWEELARKAEEAAADLSQPVPAEAAAPIAASPQAAVLAGATTRATAKQPGLPKAAGPKSSETLVALALRRQYLKELFLDCISHGWSKYSQGPFRLLVLQGECGMEGLRASICSPADMAQTLPMDIFPLDDAAGQAAKLQVIEHSAVTAPQPKVELPPVPAEAVTALQPKVELPAQAATALQPKVELPPVTADAATALQPKVELPPVPAEAAMAPQPKVELPAQAATAPQPKVELPTVLAEAEGFLDKEAAMGNSQENFRRGQLQMRKEEKEAAEAEKEARKEAKLSEPTKEKKPKGRPRKTPEEVEASAQEKLLQKRQKKEEAAAAALAKKEAKKKEAEEEKAVKAAKRKGDGDKSADGGEEAQPKNVGNNGKSRKRLRRHEFVLDKAMEQEFLDLMKKYQDAPPYSKETGTMHQQTLAAIQIYESRLITPYWTRPAVGLKVKETKKQIFYFSIAFPTIAEWVESDEAENHFKMIQLTAASALDKFNAELSTKPV